MLVRASTTTDSGGLRRIATQTATDERRSAQPRSSPESPWNGFGSAPTRPRPARVAAADWPQGLADPVGEEHADWASSRVRRSATETKQDTDPDLVDTSAPSFRLQGGLAGPPVFATDRWAGLSVASGIRAVRPHLPVSRVVVSTALAGAAALAVSLFRYRGKPTQGPET